MQAMLTNRNTTPVPCLLKYGTTLWETIVLMPGIERTIADDRITEVYVDQADPGTAPSGAQSTEAKTLFLAAIALMDGRSDAAALADKITFPLLVKPFGKDASVAINGGAGAPLTVVSGGAILSGQKFAITQP